MIKVDAFILIISIILQLYSLFDCARTDQEQVRKLPKWAWLVLILLFGGFGAVMWIFIGRPRTQGKGRGYGQKPRIIPPDDDPDFLRKL